MCRKLRTQLRSDAVITHSYGVYILASQPRGTLYIGVTNNLWPNAVQVRIDQGILPMSWASRSRALRPYATVSSRRG